MAMAMERNLRDLSGTRDFAEALAEQERALGLVLAPTPPPEQDEPNEPPTLFDSNAEPVPAPEELEEPDDADSTAAVLTQPSLDAHTALDPWGNTILGAPGPFGQYRIVSARDDRILRVCGEAATTAHLWAWDYDEGERRFVCSVCWGKARAVSDSAAADAANDQTAITATLSDEVAR